ncbi:methionine--tRNA ligase [Rickettsia endosymbiont of Cardiosporidium cionae]|uniref:methionine--tRNA ligase n=1 Tax=Rickettsia endosymbiont of Cardiosporidium cionae TaxID=2777155 RepID=UPI001892E4FD|nr:methionine--tRNA ligase [Rickettsia endosymbiont of Cardiosporidium cionae]KAF8818707.1 methionine--tRNA ligase [Rickettsia endosymbiont of Cardiosporidium cionae]
MQNLNKSNSFYITTPIFYVNDKPHIGHLYSCIIADVIARLMRMQNKEVLFLTGTDEHGQKILKSATESGKKTYDFVTENSEFFKKLTKDFDITNTDFIRTTEERHKNTVQSLWKKLLDNGDIYLGKYKGWYSLRDESFYNVTELDNNGLAPTGSTVEWLEETSYFFALSKWQDALIKFYDSNPDFIKPKQYMNEVKNFVKSGLNDLSISRLKLKWGIKVPNDISHVIYVWLDALTNYISALNYGTEDASLFYKYWPANLHIIGKDILKFHAIYWPAFLMSAKIALPKTIFSHGWWTNEGQKISKSLGNVIDPCELLENFGIDLVRYFMIRGISLGNDGDYSKNKILLMNNTELVNKIGNLIHRTCVFAYNNCNQAIPEILEYSITEIYNKELLTQVGKYLSNLEELITNYKVDTILEYILGIVELGNKFIDNKEPWKLKKHNKISDMNLVIYQLLELIRCVCIVMQAFTPKFAEVILNQISVPKNERKIQHLNYKFALKYNTKISEPQIIFQRL